MWLYSVIVHWCNPIDHPWAAMLDVPFGAIKSSFLFGYKEYIKKSLERSMIQFLRWRAQLNTCDDANGWVSVCFYHSVWSTISASVPIPRSTPAPWPPVSYSRSSPPWTSSWGETTPEMVPLYTLSLSISAILIVVGNHMDDSRIRRHLCLSINVIIALTFVLTEHRNSQFVTT